jgi:hypothetical protein
MAAASVLFALALVDRTGAGALVVVEGASAEAVVRCFGAIVGELQR